MLLLFASPACLAKESFSYPETTSLFKQLEEVSRRSSVSRAQAFEDFLHVTVCALGHPRMEDEYLQTVERHKDGGKGKRGIDTLVKMFANLINITTETDIDLRCVRMTAINLAMRNLYGHVVCGDSLRMTTNAIYETGRVQVWGNVIRKVRRVHLPNREPEELVPPMQNHIEAARRVLEDDELESTEDMPLPAENQLKLF